MHICVINISRRSIHKFNEWSEITNVRCSMFEGIVLMPKLETPKVNWLRFTIVCWN